ncbi:MAG: class IV adenylate cyclase [Candidatus Krumholzibacteria bacterium]|nr:class IV adenylate cyclase [Candidatus Krumholzibacteria bacterium]
MARNVEIKARVADPARLRKLALAMGDGPGQLILQKDTFYNAREGRLKLREFGDGTGELIAYSRPDQEGPKTSSYVISRTADPASLHTALAAALGVRGVVSKKRTLVLAGRTRIHLDQVEGLGEFMELEVVLTAGETEAEGQLVAQELMTRLEIKAGDLMEDAYIDQLEKL